MTFKLEDFRLTYRRKRAVTVNSSERDAVVERLCQLSFWLVSPALMITRKSTTKWVQDWGMIVQYAYTPLTILFGIPIFMTAALCTIIQEVQRGFDFYDQQ